ncbi:hypothetical protein [Methyloceanibacter sp.]|uniref:hypothetical protein n=1 Tax=Methyloceanibacter sp. TaxID=1965321 RepID=UPI002D3C9367|nr:hypothetical protein [Methyloceanibacter sp.]HZP10707.1 hypothetical protein [Methyloceanibacter sp.]
MRFLPLVVALSLLFTVPAAARPVAVPVDGARNIAFHYGVVMIKDIDLDDGVWEVVGFDSYGAKIKIWIDAWSGAVVKIKRK